MAEVTHFALFSNVNFSTFFFCRTGPHHRKQQQLWSVIVYGAARSTWSACIIWLHWTSCMSHVSHLIKCVEEFQPESRLSDQAHGRTIVSRNKWTKFMPLFSCISFGVIVAWRNPTAERELKQQISIENLSSSQKQAYHSSYSSSFLSSLDFLYE